MATFVLVHGAWVWDQLRAELQARGHATVAMDLTRPSCRNPAEFCDYLISATNA